MLFAALFTDKPDHGALRARLLQAHIDWVARHKDTILVAGSLRHEPADVPVGGLWVVQAESKQAVLALMQTDPFWTGGLRERVEVFHWSKALENHKTWV